MSQSRFLYSSTSHIVYSTPNLATLFLDDGNPRSSSTTTVQVFSQNSTLEKAKSRAGRGTQPDTDTEELNFDMEYYTGITR